VIDKLWPIAIEQSRTLTLLIDDKHELLRNKKYRPVIGLYRACNNNISVSLLYHFSVNLKRICLIQAVLKRD